MNNSFFPLFIDLKDKKVLLVGAGKISFRKACTLKKYGAIIEIVSEKIDKSFEIFPDIKIYQKRYEEKDLQDYFLVIAATENSSLNHKIVEDCKTKNILVNNITSKTHMTCRFGSISENEEYQIAISAYGHPSKSKSLKEEINHYLIQRSDIRMKKVIHTEKAPAALGPYSQAIEANGVLYVSGQIPFVPATMTLVSDDVQAQTRQSLENIGAILEEAGYSFRDVVKASVFIKDMNDFAKINEVYNEYLGEAKPARACVEVARLPKDVKVEIEVIATK